MPATHGDVIREVQLTCPAVPPLLIRQWAFDAYAKLLSGQRWGWQRVTTTIRIDPAREDIALVLAPGTATVTSAGLFVAADAGKQILIGGEPRLTIASFTDANTVVLEEVYEGTSTAVTADIIENFYTPPAAFQQFVTIQDFPNRRPIPWWVSLEQVRVWDPLFEHVGQPRALFALTSRRYQWWPANTVGGTYEAVYLVGPTTSSLTDDTALPEPLADRHYVLRDAVLMRCAMYPGTPSEKNPYFNLSLARELQQQFEIGRKDLGIVDDDQMPTQVIDNIDWGWVSGRRALSDHNYQYSDATAVGFPGLGYYGY